MPCIAFVVTATLGACSPAPEPPTAPSSAPASPSGECLLAPSTPITADQAAVCVYKAWVDQNDELFAVYGEPGITDEVPVVMEDPLMNFKGCSDGAGRAAVTCEWVGGPPDDQFTLVMSAVQTADGFRINTMKMEW